MILRLCGLNPFQCDAKNDEEMMQNIGPKTPFRWLIGKITVYLESGKLEWLGDAWEFVSIEAKDLMEGLLNKDAQRRLTARKAFAHPWTVRNRFLNSRKLCNFTF